MLEALNMSLAMDVLDGFDDDTTEEREVRAAMVTARAKLYARRDRRG